MTQHYIVLGNEKKVGIAAYVSTLKAVFAAPPDIVYPHGLTTWWQTSGADIRKQFRQSIHDRINTKSGQDWRNHTTNYETEERRDCQKLRDYAAHRLVIHQLMTKQAKHRFSQLISPYNEL